MKILIADKLHHAFKDRAGILGFDVDDQPEISRQETLDIIGGYDGIAIRTKFRMDKELIEAGKKLKFIARAGAGMDNIDEHATKEAGIICINAPEGNRDAVGEHAIGMLLGLLNKLRKADTEVRNQIWDREGNRGTELKGKTIAIIGYGFMGKAFAEKLIGFGVNILAYDKYQTDFGNEWVQEASMEQIVKEADILSLHIPLTRETKQMVDHEYLLHFKKPIILLNTARGEIVHTESILQAMETGKIAAAGLDVLEVEKFPALQQQAWYLDLIKQDRLLLSPHVAGWTVESYRKISEVLAEKLARLNLI